MPNGQPPYVAALALTALGSLMILATSCGGATQAPRSTSEPFTVRAAPSDLLAQLHSDPHHYFRYVAAAFVARECAVAARGPTVNLHGDAHVEQYLVTSLGRGLGDFDEATTGPVEIDLVRLATSLRIAGRMRGWNARRLWVRFLEGYIAALEDPEARAPEPRFAARVRGGFDREHVDMLAWCDTLFEPIDAVEAAQVEVALGRFVDRTAAGRPGLDRASFEVVRLGRHSLGVGSRRMVNYLIRTRGPTDAPEDDLIFEAKAVSMNPEATCLPLALRADPLRVLVGEARLSYAPFELEGTLEIDGRPYWIHEFVDNYVELTLEDESLDEAQMLEVLYDMGVQLGLGHPRRISAPYDAELRHDLISFIGAEAGSIWDTSEHMLEAVWAGWRELQASPSR